MGSDIAIVRLGDGPLAAVPTLDQPPGLRAACDCVPATCVSTRARGAQFSPPKLLQMHGSLATSAQLVGPFRR